MVTEDESMVAQPAYLKALKKYARMQFGDDEMVADISATLDSESDRGAFILSATSIEDSLEYAIGMRMKILETDVAARKEVFGSDGLLSTYSSKILMAYSLGIIDRRARKDIDLVREIRNACAHCRLPISMGLPDLANAVKAALGEDMLKQARDHKPKTLRIGFICHCAALSAYVATGIRRSPLEALDDLLKGDMKIRE
jgi:hypothetical protein